MLDYGIPRACDIPEMEVGQTVFPSPNNELGVKGSVRRRLNSIGMITECYTDV